MFVAFVPISIFFFTTFLTIEINRKIVVRIYYFLRINMDVYEMRFTEHGRLSPSEESAA